MLGADDPWRGVLDAVPSRATFFDCFLSLSRISARFSARMVQAGALSALEQMAAKQLMHCGDAAEHWAGTEAAITTAQVEAVVMGCCAAFGRLVAGELPGLLLLVNVCCCCMPVPVERPSVHEMVYSAPHFFKLAMLLAT